MSPLFPALPHPRGRSTRPYLISAGPSPARSRLWTACRPPWPAACTGAHPASRHTHRPHHSLLSPGQCCTSAEPLASFGTLPGDREEKREVTVAAGPEERGPSEGRVSQVTTYDSPLTVPNATTSKGCYSCCTFSYLLRQQSGNFLWQNRYITIIFQHMEVRHLEEGDHFSNLHKITLWASTAMAGVPTILPYDLDGRSVQRTLCPDL